MDNIQPAVEAMEAFDAIHKVIGNLMEGFPDIPDLFELLDHTSVDGAGFKLLDVVEGDIHEKKAFLTIYTSSTPVPHQSNYIITEIEDDNSSSTETIYNPLDDHVESDAMMSNDEGLSAHMTISTPAPKKQKKIAKDVTEVRRSSRIAKLCDGFKDKAAVGMAKASMTESDSVTRDINKKKKKTQVAKKSNETSFSASVIDSSAPPPPELYIDNVQAIGVGQCKILLRICLLTSSMQPVADGSIYKNSTCWARLLSYFMFISVSKNIFGHVIITRDLIWSALSYAMKTFAVLFALCVMITEYGGVQSLLLLACISLWWKQMLCLPIIFKSYYSPNDKYK
jgi:hypothetical protein